MAYCESGNEIESLQQPQISSKEAHLDEGMQFNEFFLTTIYFIAISISLLRNLYTISQIIFSEFYGKVGVTSWFLFHQL